MNKIFWSDKKVQFYHGLIDDRSIFGIVEIIGKFILVSVGDESKTVGSYNTLQEAQEAADRYVLGL